MSDYESRLPEWQRWLNQFCENWIFAFLVAMAIRHFCIEAFRIPTASMEPMLYGDPGLLKGDHVVVDKLTPRFTGYTRWDVTVFQFPRPELENGDDARPALDSTGERLDSPLLNPLFCRNFVKRMVAVPGDVFYISGGDIHLKQADGTFAVARKPASTQEAVWQDIYLQGDQPSYLPWAADAGQQVSAAGDAVTFTVAGAGQVHFTQPLRNVYVKPGLVRAIPRPKNSDGDKVDVSMTKPLFNVAGREGSLWDLDNWEIQRLTAKDLDRGYGRALNDVMDEWVGDVRLSGTIQALSGIVALTLAQGQPGIAGSHLYTCELTPTAWRITGDGKELVRGEGNLVGRALRFAHLDSQVILELDGVEKARLNVPVVDSNLQRLHLAVAGTGTLRLGSARLQRDVYYCSRGFLRTDLEAWKNSNAMMNSSLPFEANRGAEDLRLMEMVRSQMRGKANLTNAEKIERWGYSEKTAITVPANAYLLMGDNSPFSWDARWWGWVPGENLRGRALAVMFPPPRWRIVR